ncbi:MAG TPA: S-methyl-5-thioribose-1-phosphate isomerase [Drouetiella sp.]|jgi:methylthioribose-1-phosphate isomerase
MTVDSSQKLDIGVLPLVLDGERVLLVDQRQLPYKLEMFDATSLDDMCFAIEDMVVRGAPSIGVAAAFGLAMEAVRTSRESSKLPGEKSLLKADFLKHLNAVRLRLQATRPTAVNLRWATDKLYLDVDRFGNTNVDCDVRAMAERALDGAKSMLKEHIDTNRVLSDYGAQLVPQNAAIMTHCNAGSLATCGWGTALGVIRSAALKGLNPSVYVDETRPRNQGSKLTVWELHQDKIPATLICDSMSGHLMADGKVQMVVTGADRIAANGDSANKIGTYNLAVVANYHDVPFYIAAPISTIDPHIKSGKYIPIEERHSSEITSFNGVQTSMEGVAVYNPAFDVTPAKLIQGIITECGVLRPPYEESIARALKQREDWTAPEAGMS